MNIVNVADEVDVDIIYHLKSSEPLHDRLIKTKVSLCSQWIIEIAVR